MNFIRERIIQPFYALMRQGLSPETLAKSFAFGILAGIFPLPGVTTVVCLAFCYMFSLNLPAANLVNLMMTPIDLLLFIPFIRLGDLLLRNKSLADSTSLLDDFFGTLATFWIAIMHGIFAWLVILTPATFILYKVILYLLKNYRRVA